MVCFDFGQFQISANFKKKIKLKRCLTAISDTIFNILGPFVQSTVNLKRLFEVETNRLN